MADYYLQILVKKERIRFKYFFHKRRPVVLSSFKRHSADILWTQLDLETEKKPRKVLAFLKDGR